MPNLTREQLSYVLRRFEDSYRKKYTECTKEYNSAVEKLIKKSLKDAGFKVELSPFSFHSLESLSKLLGIGKDLNKIKQDKHDSLTKEKKQLLDKIYLSDEKQILEMLKDL